MSAESQLFEALARHDFATAVASAQAWAAASHAGDFDALIAPCPVPLRARLYVLLSDVLSDYPTTRGGVPALFVWHPGDAGRAVHVEGTRYLSLPVAQDELDSALPDAWMPATELLPAPLRLPTVHLGAGRMTAVVGVTTTVVAHPELEVSEPVLLDRIAPYPGTLRCKTGPSLPYPLAVLAAQAMAAGARGAVSAPLVREVLAEQHDHYYALGFAFRAGEAALS